MGKRIAVLAAISILPLFADAISQRERDSLISHLNKTRRALLDAVGGLTEAQWSFRPGSGRWSVAECAEHIALSESFLRSVVIDKILKKPPEIERKSETHGKDELVVKVFTDRSQKAAAPEPVAPRGAFESPGAAVQEFLKARETTMEFVRTTQSDLRAHISPNPAVGPMDAYQWLLFLSSHTERHVAQILEVKAHSEFPK